MIQKIHWGVLLAVVSLGFIAVATAELGDISDQYKGGKHVGEVAQLDVDLQFSGSSGTTVTNDTGIYYNFWGITISEPKIYPSKYWGTFPLYFFGDRVGAMVTVTNRGPKAKARLRITTQAFVLNTDGSSGVALAPEQSKDIIVERGETKVFDASFIPQYVPGADSGLDRVVILVQHINEGGGPGNETPALIMAKEAILCPPEVQAKAQK